MNKIAEALTEEMKFKAGDVVCLTATVVRWVAEFQLNGTKVDRSKYASRVLNLPPSYSVVARCVDQCPAGVVQKYYAIRGEPTHGKLPGNYHEHELCLLSDAVAQIEAVVLPPMEETMIDLAALERLLAEATRGEWGVTRRGGAPTISIVDAEGNPAPRTGMRPCGDAYPTIARLPADYSTDDANAALIAAAVNALPALIAAARERDELRAKCDELWNGFQRSDGALADAGTVPTADRPADVADGIRALTTERDALRAEVERMRAVVEAAREIDSACDRDEPRYVPCRDSSGSGALCRACRVDVALAAALAALDGKDSAK